MIYELNNEVLNKSINTLYYIKGIIVGLTKFEPLSSDVDIQIQRIINTLIEMRDCEVHLKEGD